MADKISRKKIEKKSVAKTEAASRAAKVGEGKSKKSTGLCNTASWGMTGVMNPYILARIVLNHSKKPIEPFVKDSEITPQQLISAMKTLQGSGVKTFGDIFDPAKSPIFKPQNLTRYIQIYATDDLKLTPMDQGAKDPNNTSTALSYGNANTATIQLKGRTRSAYYNDVIQGACLNCYFMASLSSAAWTYPSSIPIVLKLTSGAYSVPFYPLGGDPNNPTQIPVKTTFPLDANGNMVFAQQTPQSELWSALYEKAYAKFFPLLDSALKYAVAGDPEIGSFPAFLAVSSLSHVTGKSSYISSVNGLPPTNYNPACIDPKWGTSSYDVLTKYNISWDAGYPNNGTTKNAMVAWTYDSGSIPTNCVKLYKNPAIVSNHTYSILGAYIDNANSKYIVLRNPWGNQIDPNNAALRYSETLDGYGTMEPHRCSEFNFWQSGRWHLCTKFDDI